MYYMCLKLECTGDVVGVADTVETLVLVCPDPVMTGDVSIVVGTNTSIVPCMQNTWRRQFS